MLKTKSKSIQSKRKTLQVKEGIAVYTTKPRLDIGYTRTCRCPQTHINCLIPKEWTRNQVAIWEFYYEKRDIRDKDIHPAVFPIALPN